MSYRETTKARKYRLMREAKERQRIENGEPRDTWTPPDLRREIIVINHDTGEAHGFKLYKTDRIDQYRVTVDGRPWKDKRFALDCTKLERDCGWKAEYDFIDGLKNTVDELLRGKTI